MWWAGSGPSRSFRMSRTCSGRTTKATGAPGGARNGAVGELTASTVCPRQAISTRSGAALTTVPCTTLRSPMSRATVGEAGRPSTSAFGSGLDDPPGLVEDQAIAELVGLAEIVGDEHDGAAEPDDQGAQLLAELSAERRVEGRERLVEQQHRRVRRDGAAEGHPLLLAPREIAGVPRGQLLEAHLGEDLRRAPLPLRPRAVPEPERHVLRHRQVGEQRVALEHVAEVARLGRQMDPGRRVVEDAPVDDHPAGIGAGRARPGTGA